MRVSTWLSALASTLRNKEIHMTSAASRKGRKATTMALTSALPQGTHVPLACA